MIINSSPLIIFGKLNKIELLKEVLGNLDISEAVYKEVVEKGKLKNSSESFVIEEAIKNRIIEIKKLSKDYEKKAISFLNFYKSIDYGEAETIALALQEGNKELLIDEKAARKVASLYNLKPRGSLRVLLLAFKKKLINKEEIKKIVTEMTKEKFRLGADVLSEFFSILDKIKRD
jgi:hypothetical protein